MDFENPNIHNQWSTEMKEFAELAVQTRCRAFSHLTAFNNGEFYPSLSSTHTLPEFKFWTETYNENENEYIQGQFCFVNDSAADLHLVCSWFKSMGFDYYVLWEFSESDPQWCIWLPEIDLFDKVLFDEQEEA